jgi:hypothetical protein
MAGSLTRKTKKDFFGIFQKKGDKWILSGEHALPFTGTEALT